jgi:hypothetical protein
MSFAAGSGHLVGLPLRGMSAPFQATKLQTQVEQSIFEAVLGRGTIPSTQLSVDERMRPGYGAMENSKR